MVGILFSCASLLQGGSSRVLCDHHLSITEKGKILLTRSLGEISIGADKTQSLEMHFRSDVQPSATSLVPRHEIPLLEAKAMSINERESRILLPDGQTLFLSRKSAQHNYQVSSPWTVKVDGDRILLKNGKIKVTYRKGRIDSWETFPSQGVRWVYDDTGLIALNRFSGGSILSINKTATDLKLDIGGRSSEVNWEFEEMDEGGQKRWESLLKSYSTLGGRRFIVDSGLQGASLMETIKDEKSGGEISFGHDFISGNATMLNAEAVVIDYKFKEKRKGYEFPQVLVGGKRLHNANFISRGYKKVLEENGALIEEYYLDTPAGYKLRKRSITRGGVTEHIYRAYFNIDGNIMRDRYKDFTRFYKDGKINVYKEGELIRTY